MNRVEEWEQAVVSAWSHWGHQQAWLSSVTMVLGWLLFGVAVLAMVPSSMNWRSFLARGLVWLLVVALAMSLSRVIKTAVERPRPTNASVAWTDGAGTQSPFGMPSSHAVFYGTLAGIVAARWRARALSVGAFGIAFALGAARVLRGDHYPTDVAVGCVMGLLVGWLSWRRFVQLRYLV